MSKIISIINIIFFSLPITALAHAGEDEGMHHGMMDDVYPMMSAGWMWIWMILGLTIAVLLIALLAVLIIKLMNKPR